MYPPRRTDNSNSKSRTGPTNPSPSPSHKDMSKVNKILENAKKYQQTKQIKKDYLLEGIANLRKKEEENGMKKRRESQISSGGGSQRGDEQKRDIYRRVDNMDQGNGREGTYLQRQASNKSNEGQDREVKRGVQTNYRSTDNLHTNMQQSEAYRNQGQMIRQSDRNQGGSEQGYGGYQDANRLGSGVQAQGTTYARTYGQKQQVVSGYQYMTQQYEPVQQQQISQPQTIAQRRSYYNGSQQQQIQQQQIQQQQQQQQQASLGRVTSSPQFQVPRQQTSQNYSSKPNYQNSNSINNWATAQSQSQSYYSNSQPHAQPQPQPQLQQQSRPQLQQNYNYQYQTQSPPQTIKTNQQNNQKMTQQMMQNSANAQTQEERRNLAIKQYQDKNYLRKLQSGQIENEQKNLIKQQIEKLNQELIDMRNKFYKTEDERITLSQKCQFLQKQNTNLRAQYEKVKVKATKLQFEITNLQTLKNQAEMQMGQLKTNKDSIYDDLANKMNDLNIQYRKKCLEVNKFERICAQLEAQVNEKGFEANRLREVANRKEQQFLALQQKQYQFNKLNTVQSKTESELRNYADKISALEAENNQLRQQKSAATKIESQLSRNRKQIQDMYEDMKDLEAQLEAKDQVIEEYKKISHKGSDDRSMQMVQQELETIMRQKNQMQKSYEQKLLQKDKKISTLESKLSENSGKPPKLVGLQAGQATFQQILAAQLQQINSLKRDNNSKLTQSFTLRIQLQNLRSQLQNEANKNRLLSLQLSNNDHSASSVAESHLRAARNEIESLNRRVEGLSQTIEAKRKENLNKDQFIKQYLLNVGGSGGGGKGQQRDTGVLLENLDRILNGNR